MVIGGKSRVSRLFRDAGIGIYTSNLGQIKCHLHIYMEIFYVFANICKEKLRTANSDIFHLRICS